MQAVFALTTVHLPHTQRFTSSKNCCSHTVNSVDQLIAPRTHWESDQKTLANEEPSQKTAVATPALVKAHEIINSHHDKIWDLLIRCFNLPSNPSGGGVGSTKRISSITNCHSETICWQ